MVRSDSGAQRASFTPRSHSMIRRIPMALAVAALVLTATAAPAGATTRSTDTARTGAIALTTTTIDKPLYSVEQYYLALVNCTRTGGWVLSDGTCRGWGSSRYSAYVPPLLYSMNISDKVTRPYAKLLAVKGLCTHFANGGPGDRLRRAGYTRPTWGENIGCRDGYSTAKAAVLASHLNFQKEKATNGGHWRNIKNPKFKYIGIGVWRYGTRTRLVTDFYG